MTNIRPGDEVIHKFDETLDLLTVLEVNVNKGIAMCFEYNPKYAFAIPLEEIEVMAWQDKV